jgi:hypothetical protein
MWRKAVYCMLVLLVGCSQVPKPSTYPYSFQRKMQAAHHWNVLADKVAGGVAANLRGGSESSAKAVYVQSDDRSPFGRAFRTFLITELTKQGISVSMTPETPLQIDWAVQLVSHNADRINPPLPLAFTALAGVATGVGIAWEELNTYAASGLTAGVLGLLTDFLLGTDYGPLPHSEVIITTMITETGDKRRILARDTTPFYINDEDRWHYSSRPDNPRTGMPVVVQKVYTVVNR